MNDPPVAVTVAGEVVTTIPPIRTTICEPATYPLPMSCTVDPAVPLAGVAISVGLVNAKVFVAVLPETSVTTTVLLAVAVTGTEKAVVTVPPAPVVPAAAVIATPLTVTVNAVPAVAKPLPAMLTVDPLSIQVVGVKVIEVAMVNVSCALLTPSLSSRVYGPPGICGTMNQVVKL